MSKIDDVFGPSGLMDKAFPGYEPRAGQIEYAREVLAAMSEGRCVLAEGPTGTGKSVGYLVPSIDQVINHAADIRAWRQSLDDAAVDGAGFDLGDVPRARSAADAEKPRVVIVTANIALQEQLMGKDIPALHALLPETFVAAIAKGRNNYLCLDRFDDSAAKLLMEPLPMAEDRRKWNEIANWKERTKTGDFSELPFTLAGQLQQLVSVGSDDCTGKACGRYKECHAEAARAAFKKADVIVTNYHMFFAHLKIAAETGQGCLPRFDIVVFDEAHALADVAREFFGFTIREGSFKWATRFLGPKPSRSRGGDMGYDLDADLRNEIINGATELFSALRAFKAGPRYKARLMQRFPESAQWPWTGLIKKIRTAADLMAKAAQIGMAEGMQVQRKAELSRAERRCNILAANLEDGLDPTRDVKDEWVFFLEEEARDNVSLRAKPIDVSKYLQRFVYSSRAYRSVITTSATLATGTGEDAFNYVVKELGCDKAEELLVASPFDFVKQALLCVPHDAPDTKAKDYSDRVGTMVAKVVGAAKGRVLGLFTSYRGVKAAAEAVRREHGDRIRLLVQGDMPRTLLVDEFRKDESAVLLGTRSLWAGVDVSGMAVVFIDKIPFDSPDDPIVDAKSDDRKSFMEYSVPRASIELRQGFGRAIRSKRDRVAVVIADQRLVSKGYGKKIRAALPKAPFTRSLDDVVKFLNGGVA